MQIPALWTDLDEKQRTSGRSYVHTVLWLAQAALSVCPSVYFIGVCDDPDMTCGQCNCPIGRNHNYLTDGRGVGKPICFDCAEEEFFVPLNEQSSPDERGPVKPAFLDRYREVKFW